MLAALVPIVVILSATALLPRVGSRRWAIVWAALLCGTWLAIGTELLGAVHQLSRWPVAAWWTVALVASVIGAVRAHPTRRRWLDRPQRFDLIDRILLALVGAVMAVIVVTAVFAAPTNFDVLSYHLPRQLFWIQGRSVAHFPASDARMLHMPPFAEFAGVHLMLLSGGDLLSNLPQTTALLLCLVAASLAVSELGGSRRAQLIAAALVVTCPPIFFQGSSPKNDIVLAAWLMVALAMTLRAVRTRSLNFADGLGIGTALGLAVLTKGTAIVYALPLAALVAWAVFAVRPRGRAVIAAVAIPLIVVVLNAPHTYRNYKAFGHPSGPDGPRTEYSIRMYDNESRGPAALTSNIVRNATLHLALPSAGFNTWLEAQVESLHRGLGLATNDPRTTFMAEPYEVSYLPNFEDRAGATVHFLLVILLPVAAFAVRKHLPPGPTFWLVTALPLAAFLVFCAVLTWQPWHTRLHIPMFCLAAVPAGVLLATAPIIRTAAGVLLAAVAVLAPCVINGPRPLFGERSIFTHDRLTQMTSLFPWDPQALFAAVRLADRPEVDVVGLHVRFGVYQAQWMLGMGHGGKTIVSPFPKYAVSDASSNPVADVVLSDYPAVPLLEGKQPGAPYALVAKYDPVSAYARTDVARRVRFDDSTLAWAGLEPVSGLTTTAPRTAIGPSSTFKFYGVKPRPLRLTVRGRTTGDAPVLVRARIGRRPVFDFELPPDRDTVFAGSFVPRGTGYDILTFEYEPKYAGKPGPTQSVARFEDVRLLADLNPPPTTTTAPTRPSTTAP